MNFVGQGENVDDIGNLAEYFDTETQQTTRWTLPTISVWSKVVDVTPTGLKHKALKNRGYTLPLHK